MSQSEYEAVQDFIVRSPESEYIESVTRQEKRLDLGDGVAVEMCRFRDMDLGRCAVYAARPLICRLMGHVEWLPCPIEKIERLPDTRDAIALLQSYSESKRDSFETWQGAR
jgi:Fe-S-cluster containining protein